MRTDEVHSPRTQRTRSSPSSPGISPARTSWPGAAGRPSISTRGMAASQRRIRRTGLTAGDSFEARRTTVSAAGAVPSEAGDDEGPFRGIEPFAAERFALDVHFRRRQPGLGQGQKGLGRLVGQAVQHEHRHAVRRLLVGPPGLDVGQGAVRDPVGGEGPAAARADLLGDGPMVPPGEDRPLPDDLPGIAVDGHVPRVDDDVGAEAGLQIDPEDVPAGRPDQPLMSVRVEVADAMERRQRLGVEGRPSRRAARRPRSRCGPRLSCWPASGRSVWMLSSGRVPGGLMMMASWYCRKLFHSLPSAGSSRGLDDQTLILRTHEPSG